VLPGLNTADGLARVGGNRTLYLSLLRQFVDRHGDTVEQVTRAVASEDYTLAERLAHSLKGVAGNIGAGGVQSAAGLLEKAIRERSDPSALDSAKMLVGVALVPLVDGLRTVLPQPTPATPARTDAAPVSATESRDAASRLLMLLSDFDPDAANFTEAHGAALQALFGPEAWLEFVIMVKDYAFDDARWRLETAVSRLTSSL